MMKNTFLLMLVAILLPAFQAGAQVAKGDDLLGKWQSADKDAHIQISKEKGKYFGKIVWLKDPNDPATGKPKLDKLNPVEKLRTQPTLGLVILKDFLFTGEEWEGGTIYDPKSGNIYKCLITLDGKNKIFVRGYIGKAWMGLGRTTEWTRIGK